MPSKRTTRLADRTPVCQLCDSVIDVESGFVFDLQDGQGGLVHPDCMAYSLTYGDCPVYGVTHTCGNPICVKPDHLEMVIPPVECDFDGMGSDAIGCSAADGLPWAFDHFHAIIGGEPCRCRHATAPAALTAHPEG